MCALHKPQLDVQGGHPSTLWSCKYCIFIISIHFHLNNSLTDGGGEYMDFFKSAKHTVASIYSHVAGYNEAGTSCQLYTY
jgi:hypothetical protein